MCVCVTHSFPDRGTLARLRWGTQSPHTSALKLNPRAMLSSPSTLSNPSMLSSRACKTTGSSHRSSIKVGNCPEAKTPTSLSSKLRWATGTSARTSRASSTAMPSRGSLTTSHPKSCCFSWHSECVHSRGRVSRLRAVGCAANRHDNVSVFACTSPLLCCFLRACSFLTSCDWDVGEPLCFGFLFFYIRFTLSSGSESPRVQASAAASP